MASRVLLFSLLLFPLINDVFSEQDPPGVHHHHHHDSRDYHRHLHTAEHVTHVRITRTDDGDGGGDGGRPWRRLEEGGNGGIEAPYGRSVRAEFDAFGKSYSMDLVLNEQLFAEGATTRTYDEDGNEVIRPMRAHAYMAKGPEGQWVRATIHGDDVMHCAWSEGHADEEVKMLVPLHTYADSLPDAVATEARDRGTRMLAYRLREMDLDHHLRGMLKHWVGREKEAIEPIERRQEQEEEGGDAAEKEWGQEYAEADIDTDEEGSSTEDAEGARTRRQLPAMGSVWKKPVLLTSAPYGVMAGCPSTLYKFSAGFAADAGYTQAITKFGSTGGPTAAAAVSMVELDLQSQVNIVNFLYVDMINIFLTIAEFDIRTTVGVSTWNQAPLDPSTLVGSNRHTVGCPTSRTITTDSDYSTSLSNFGAWRASLVATRRYAVWHQLTNCYPPSGTVGLAYMGVTCSTTNYGAGWSSFLTDGTWLTVAHEMGHNLNAYHTFSTTGIMSYSPTASKVYTFTSTNPTEVCSHVNAVKGVCYTAWTSTCGNGLIEPGEECDDTSACCDRTTCKLAAGASCTPGADSVCCSSTCTYLPTTTPCTVKGGTDKGYCYNGICRLNRLSAAYNNLIGCQAPTAAACKEVVSFNGLCGYTDSSFGLTGYNMPDGAYCNAALTSVCSAGSCVSATTGATATTTTTTTKTPTRVPTRMPSALPSRSPTNRPTAPTKLPTLVPTARPTNRPTSKPTALPTRVPTLLPTAPTTTPTNRPTAMPTRAPSRAPTNSPTKQPTAAPTRSPTFAPTAGPTRSPTIVPTAPTTSPTNTPTGLPTRAPSSLPTKAPTKGATKAPTKAPTKSPSMQPTTSPTTMVRHHRHLAEEQASGQLIITDPVPLVSHPESSATESFTSLQVINPHFAEILYIGSVALVRWITAVDLSSVDITLSDGSVIARGVPAAQGSHYWVVSSSPGKSYVVTVHGHEVSGGLTINATSEAFSIEAPATLTIIDPKKGEDIVQGQPTWIQWTTTGIVTRLDISLVPLSPAYNTTLIGSYSNSESIVWIPSTDLAAGKYLVLMAYSSPSKLLDYSSSAIFDLVPATEDVNVTVIAPIEGDMLEAGKSITIMWTSAPAVVDVNITLIRPSMGLVMPLYSGLNLNSWTWTVQGPGNSTIPTGIGYAILIEDSWTDGINGTSGTFGIVAPQPSIVVTSIFEGQLGSIWARGCDALVYFTTTDPMDTISLSIFDQTGTEVFLIAPSVATSPYVYSVSHAVPPPDCFSCHLVATSNLYNTRYQYPDPLTIGSSDYNDISSERVPSSLLLTFPIDGATLTRGKQYNITWIGVLVPTVSIVLQNLTSGHTALLSTELNTGTFTWSLDPRPTIRGDYRLYLSSLGGTLITDAISFSIMDPIVPLEPSIDVVAPSDTNATWHSGDSLTVTYTSEGVYSLFRIDLYSSSLGFLSTLTTTAPSAATLTFTLPDLPAGINYLSDVYISVSADESLAVAAKSLSFAIYAARSISGVILSNKLLSKGGTYYVNWTATGEPFPIKAILYRGNSTRRAVNGQLCVPWRDASGANITGCGVSYDLVNEVCATSVDQDGQWLTGGPCAELSSHYKMIMSFGPFLSTQNRGPMSLPMAATDLPAIGTDYSLILSGPSIDLVSDTVTLAITAPAILTTFNVIQTDPGVLDLDFETALREYASVQTGIEISRLSVVVTGRDSMSDAALISVALTISMAIHPLEKSALEGARDFEAAWQDPDSSAYDTSSDWPFQLDPSSEPTIKILDDAATSTSSSAPPAITPAPTPIVDYDTPITQQSSANGLDLETPEDAPAPVGEPETDSTTDSTTDSSTAEPTVGASPTDESATGGRVLMQQQELTEEEQKRSSSSGGGGGEGRRLHLFLTASVLVSETVKGSRRLFDMLRGGPASPFALLVAAAVSGVFAFLGLWMWRKGTDGGRERGAKKKTRRPKAAVVRPSAAPAK